MKALRIVVHPDAEVRDETITTKAGQEMRIYNQAAEVFGRTSTGGLIPMQIRLGEGKPYEPDVYEIAGTAIDIGGFGELRFGFGRLLLVPVASSDPSRKLIAKWVAFGKSVEE